MLRILGSILILGASLWFGISLALKEKYRLEELEELERGLLYLQGQIQYLSAPLAEALENVGWRTDGQVGRIFQQAAGKMAERQAETAEQVWQEVWKTEAVHTFFTGEDLDAVLLFGIKIKIPDTTQTIATIAATIILDFFIINHLFYRKLLQNHQIRDHSKYRPIHIRHPH